jgi:hypothetical protein
MKKIVFGVAALLLAGAAVFVAIIASPSGKDGAAPPASAEAPTEAQPALEDQPAGLVLVADKGAAPRSFAASPTKNPQAAAKALADAEVALGQAEIAAVTASTNADVAFAGVNGGAIRFDVVLPAVTNAVTQAANAITSMVQAESDLQVAINNGATRDEVKQAQAAVRGAKAAAQAAKQAVDAAQSALTIASVVGATQAQVGQAQSLVRGAQSQAQGAKQSAQAAKQAAQAARQATQNPPAGGAAARAAAQQKLN